MLGNLISEEKGRITSQRVLDVEGVEPKIETSFSATGNFRGIETTATVTYCGSPRPGGAIYGEGQGVLMGKDGTGNGNVDRTGHRTIYKSRKDKIYGLVIF